MDRGLGGLQSRSGRRGVQKNGMGNILEIPPKLFCVETSRCV
jgi:hypothetical protein